RKVALLSNANDDVPRMPPTSAPNISPKPNSQNSDAETRKLAKFLIATLIEFFDRTKPLSSAVKPACMKRTRAAQTSSHAMSAGAACGLCQRGRRGHHAPARGVQVQTHHPTECCPRRELRPGALSA